MEHETIRSNLSKHAVILLIAWIILLSSGIFTMALAADEEHGAGTVQAAPSAQGKPASRGRPYAGHRVVRVEVRDKADLDLLLSITRHIWSHHIRDDKIDVRVLPDQFDDLLQTGLPFEILIEDLQACVDAEAAEIEARSQMKDLSWFENYKPFSEYENRINQLAATYPSLVQHTIVGNSIEGRDIHVMVISGPGAADGRPVIVITGGQHAREWISGMTAMFLADQLVENYTSNARIQQLLDSVRFIIAPMMNPDGYEYSFPSRLRRFWRKNRNPNPGFTCNGVDLNRNWSFAWGGPGSDPEPCDGGDDNTYRGTAPFSEPELSGFVSFLTGYAGKVEAFIDFHSYGQYILGPWSYTDDPPPNLGLYDELSEMMANAIQSVHGEIYVYGSTYDMVYQASGTADDWGFGMLGALSWTIELRDTGSCGDPEGCGFCLPPDQILPTAEENFEAVLQLAESLMPPKIAWTDFPYVGTEIGTFTQPFDTVAESVSAAQAGGTVTVKAGSSDEGLTITKALTLRSFGGIATIGQADAAWSSGDKLRTY